MTEIKKITLRLNMDVPGQEYAWVSIFGVL